MPTLTAFDLVDIWERGHALGRAERACLLLGRAHPDMSHEALDALPLGTRDHLLLELRAKTFGGRLESVVNCPNCNEPQEISLDVQELRAGPAPDADLEAEWTNGDLTVRLRVPTGGDLRDLEGCEDREQARRRLIERCVVDARRGEETIEPSRLTHEETVALAERVAQADPGGELMLAGDCPSCGQRWEALLDVAAFLWHELEIRVKGLLAEVHTLAWSYSWSERDILSMSAWRRRIYLELLGR